jgi:hypothetical protein
MGFGTIVGSGLDHDHKPDRWRIVAMPEWLSSPNAFRKYLRDVREFNSSIGLTEEAAQGYQRSLFAGCSREDAFEDTAANLELKNHVTWKHVRETLENLPGPGEV